uniref:DUF4218 domain-containing protein n=1 Tax=Lactuca sativa TaxID=4236 RepID=A0A9R1XBP1_LACSA|nr:hypothetical protein LSAT_V11C500241900 [Lactuca sativa]
MDSTNRNHSAWPILTVIYNLPPWLCMKRKFSMLSLLISGTLGNDIDVFLTPFIDDLQLLFDIGVETYDAYAREQFKLRPVVLWTINDFPALVVVLIADFKVVLCMAKKHTEVDSLNRISRVMLAVDDFYRMITRSEDKKKAFNGQQEFAPSPKPMNGEEIYNSVKFIINKWGKVSKGNEAEIQQSTTGRGGKINKTKEKITPSGQLRYWRDNLIPHCIDFMHVKKNVGESLTGTVLNIPGKTKDGYKARLDFVHYGLKPELHPKIEGNNTTLPAAGCTLKKEEKDNFYETLYNLSVPQGYCSNFSSLVSLKDRKLIRLKSHDYHMLIKEIKLDELDKLFMKVVKVHVRNKNRPEGCIAEENVTEETIEFSSEFLKNMDTVGIPPDNHNKGVDSSSITDGTPLSAAKSVEVSAKVFSKAHFFVLQNTSEVLPYIKGCRESITETIRWISHGPNKNIIKYDAYAINGYTFRTKAREGKFYQNSGVSVVATNTHILNEFQFSCVTGLTIEMGPARSKNVYCVQTPPKNYRDTYEDVDEEFSIVVPQNDNILSRVYTIDLQKENDYFRTDCHGILIRTICKGKAKP